MMPSHDVVGVVVALDDGRGGAYVIGDTIGVYRGADVPEYFA
jgi:hypothetical protein